MANEKNIINILYCLDEESKDYSRHLGVSVYSLCEHNKNNSLHIHIITSKLAQENKFELERIVKSFNQKITFFYDVKEKIIPENIVKYVLQVHKGHRPISTWYRLFFFYCFPKLEDRILYLDCDTIINGDISRLYFADFGDNVIIGCNEPVTRYINSKRLKMNGDNYVNGGVILFDISCFKQQVDFEKDFLKIINDKEIKFTLNDQDFINYCFQGKIKIVDGKYNFMIGNLSPYEKSKINNAIIIHTLLRPFKYNRCPEKVIDLYNKYLGKTKRGKEYLNINIKKTPREIFSIIYSYIIDSIGFSIYKMFGEKIYSKYYYIFNFRLVMLLLNLGNYI